MINLRPTHRVHIPNSLAIFAVLFLLISAVANSDTNQEEVSSGQETIISAKAEDSGNDGLNTETKTRSRGLNLGLLLFRRG
ncbi:MAG: hypothetical protein QNK19_09745 [Xanthomonadales bacterium]|nr:hypothetical protein [Xanthomonadales bacterium]